MISHQKLISYNFNTEFTKERTMTVMTQADWDMIANFTQKEFRCKCGCKRADMHLVFIRQLQIIRSLIDKPIKINSGFRCPEYNAKVSSTGLTGPHTTGYACDIGIFGIDAYYLLLTLVERRMFTGLGFAQKGVPGGRFIHVDMLKAPQFPRPALWTY